MEIFLCFLKANKKIYVFQVTRNFKIGTVVRKIFFYVESFYVGEKGETVWQYCEIP